MHGLVELLSCLADHYHVVLSRVRAPWMWGFFVCFAPCFAYPMEGKDIMNMILFVIVILCAPICPVTYASLGEDQHGPPPCIICQFPFPYVNNSLVLETSSLKGGRPHFYDSFNL